MEQIFSGGMTSFFITFLVIPAIIVVASKKKLYDEPDDKRKFHSCPIPSLGGLGMFIGFILSLLLTLNFSTDAPEFQYYIAAFTLIFFVGIKDDIIIISPIKKFIGQLFAASIIVFKAKLLITNLDGFLGLYELNTIFSYVLTIFVIAVIMNAFNLIDGVDGLAGSVGLLCTLVFGIFFLVNGNLPYAVLAFTFAGSLFGFLYYNFNPAKIFMGDTGSLMIGLLNGILVLKFIETGSSYTNYPVAAAPAIGFGILLLPLMDTLRVFAVRLMNGRSPFSPDRNHIHHLLLNRGFTHKSVTYTCAGATALFVLLAFSLQSAGTSYLILILITLFFSLVYAINYKKAKYKLRVIKGEGSKVMVKEDIRLVSLYEKTKVVVKEE